MKRKNFSGILASIITYLILSFIYGFTLGISESPEPLSLKIIGGNFIILLLSGYVYAFITKDKITTNAGFIGFMIMLTQHIIVVIFLNIDFSIITLAISLIIGYIGYSLGSLIIKLTDRKTPT